MISRSLVRRPNHYTTEPPKAVGGAYNDVIVYVTVIRMAFMLTDQHRVASFDNSIVDDGIALPPTSEVKCNLVTPV